ncbi:hypothetical protein AAY473_022893 [Plecturocebus cupreus]
MLPRLVSNSLGSRNPPTLASRSVGITGVSCHTQPVLGDQEDHSERVTIRNTSTHSWSEAGEPGLEKEEYFGRECLRITATMYRGSDLWERMKRDLIREQERTDSLSELFISSIGECTLLFIQSHAVENPPYVKAVLEELEPTCGTSNKGKQEAWRPKSLWTESHSVIRLEYSGLILAHCNVHLPVLLLLLTMEYSGAVSPHCNLCLPGSSDSPALTPQVAGTKGMQHHTRLIFVFLVETGFHHDGQDGLDLLTS